MLWERLFELFPQELEQAQFQMMAGRLQLARPYLQQIMDALGREVDMVAQEAQYRSSYQTNPKDTQALNFFALLHLVQGEWEAAADAWKRSLAVSARQPDILFSLGCLSMALWRLEDAIASFAHVLQLMPEHPAAYLRLAQCYHALGRCVEASEVLDELLIMTPHYPEALALRIDCHLALGEREEAAVLCRRALALFPERAELFLLLTEVATPLPEDALVAHAERAWANTALPDHERALFGFGLYRVYEAAGQHGEAFAYLKEANALKRHQIEFDTGALAVQFATVKAFTPTPMVLESVPAASDIIPIFLIGMPHSGAAQVEHMLSSHPAIHGAGELDYFQRLALAEMQKITGMAYPHCLPKLVELEEKAIQSLREYYLARLRAHDGSAKYIVDRLPGNFFSVGLIRTLFPEAKIIHCRRDPVATCFSIYRQPLAETLLYGYDLAVLVAFWKEYDALMRHWHALYPESIHTIRYDVLATDPEGEIRKILNYFGLPWNDACLKANETRPVCPAAQESDWRRYEAELAELVAGLR